MHLRLSRNQVKSFLIFAFYLSFLSRFRSGGTATSPLLGTFCGSQIPKIIPAHSNKIYLNFKSDLTKSGKGFEIFWDGTTTGIILLL